MAQENKQGVESEPITTTTESTSGSIARRPQREVETSRHERAAPLSVFRRFVDDMDRLFSGFGLAPLSPLPVDLVGNVWSPAIETYERDDRIVFRADLPGLDKSDVKVEIEGDELIVSGERKQEHEEKSGGRYYSERRYGSFERRIMLPEGVDPESVDATFDNGVLEVSLATPERAKPRSKKVDIKAGGQQKRDEPKEEEKGVESIH